MEYEPEYAQGQILVVFKDDQGEGFARGFGKTLGYELSDERYEHGEAYIFETEVGGEKKAKEKFSEYSDFIDCVSLRDIKIEARWEGLEQAMTEVQGLHDDSELPDNLYRKRLEGIVNRFKQLLD